MSASLVIAMFSSLVLKCIMFARPLKSNRDVARATVSEQCEYSIAIAETICFSAHTTVTTRRPPEVGPLLNTLLDFKVDDHTVVVTVEPKKER